MRGFDVEFGCRSKVLMRGFDVEIVCWSKVLMRGFDVEIWCARRERPEIWIFGPERMSEKLV
jgi:hypothetical protein